MNLKDKKNTKKAVFVPPANDKKSKNIEILLLLGILLITVVSFFNLKNFGFTNYDDDVLIYKNLFVSNFNEAGFLKLFTNSQNGLYHPLTTFSWIIDHFIWGMNPKAFHLMNLMYHLVNIILVYFFTKLLFRNSTITIVSVALFAIHPMHVESVAWLAERKDVLFSMFYLLGLITYLLFRQNSKTKKFLILTILFAILSLFSKPAAISFPLTLLAIDYFLDGKITKQHLINKIPLLLLSIIFGIISLNAASLMNDVIQMSNYHIFDRIILALFAILFYLFKFGFPINLSAKYSYPEKVDGFLPIEYYLAAVFLILIFIIIFRYRKHLKVIFFGTLFFLSLIIPVLPIFAVGDSIAGDRYSYLSFIGFGFIVAYYFENLLYKKNYVKFAPFFKIIFFGIILIFAFSSFHRIEVWKNSISLWEDVIKKNPKNYLAYVNKGDAEMDLSKIDVAINDYSNAIIVNPNYAGSYNNRGLAYFHQRNYTESLKDFNSAIKIKNDFIKVYYNRSCVYIEINENQKAIDDCNKVIAKMPNFDLAYYNRGNAFINTGKLDFAIKDFDKAISLNDQLDKFYISKAKALFLKNDSNKTFSNLAIAEKLNSNNFEIYFQKGKYYKHFKNLKEANFQFTKAIELNPNNADYFFSRANCKAQLNDLDGALQDFTKTIELNQGYAPAYYGRAFINQQKGNLNSACEDWNNAEKFGLKEARQAIESYCK